MGGFDSGHPSYLVLGIEAGAMQTTPSGLPGIQCRLH